MARIRNTNFEGVVVVVSFSKHIFFSTANIASRFPLNFSFKVSSSPSCCVQGGPPGWSRCSMLATPFYICVYLYTCPIDYLDFCSSRFLTSGLRTSGFWISSHLESRPWTSGLRASGFQTSGHPDFWPFRFLPASIKCLDQDIYGIPCRLHQS